MSLIFMNMNTIHESGHPNFVTVILGATVYRFGQVEGGSAYTKIYKSLWKIKKFKVS